jgi:IclR family pca regulon transcriptional regulator
MQGNLEPSGRDLIAGLSRGLQVIEAFDRDHPRLSIADVARLTGLGRAAARRYLLTLVKDAYAAFDGKYYSLTPRVLRLGYSYLAATPLPRLVQPFLERVSDATEESSSASVLEADEIVYVARAAKQRVVSIGLHVGSRLPAYCSSMGRVLLAALPEGDAAERLAAAPREQLTPHTVTGIADLMTAMAEVRRQGYSAVDQELELGLRSIAVPVYDTTGRVVAAMNVGAQAARVSVEDMIARFLPPLRQAQKALRDLLA